MVIRNPKREMEYTKRYHELKSVFNPDQKEIKVPGSGVTILNTSFSSDVASNEFLNRKDLSVPENIEFSYPVFAPQNKGSKKVIILLHGLNERSWVKYLVWAYYLSERTESYVILFPISFHINRSPEFWKDPKVLFESLNDRKQVYGKTDMASLANIVLSNRLTEDPLRFFNSGYQTVCDLVKLMVMIKNGKHNIIPAGCSVNVFAYSIGAFLGQIIFMGNPKGLFSDSKLFIFCGGSVFSNMQGTSKLIMDGLAYERVYNYYMKDFEQKIKGKKSIIDSLQAGSLAMSFRSMIDFGRFRKFRESALRRLREQTQLVALSADRVIPPAGILATMGNGPGNDYGKVEVWDFPYPYTHENPFPVFASELSLKVDTNFNRLFSAASRFLR